MNIFILIILILLINSVYTLFFNKSNTVGCGLIAFCPNEGQKANITYMQLIATFNATRGTDSCGVYINNNIQKGVGMESDIRDYMANNKITYAPNCKNKAIIAHARKSTKGVSNFANAHPFEVLNADKTSKLIGAHNGTITNCFPLSKKYGIDYSYTDVDSKFIFEVIQKTGNYKVLSEYEGAAALIMAYEEEPNVLYVFKGASREFKSSKEISDERPLFLLKRPEGVYISSMIEPLKIIVNGNKSLKIQTFMENMVIKIKDNVLSIVETVDREWINEPYVHKEPEKVTKIYPSNYKENKSGFQNSIFEKEEEDETYSCTVYPRTNREMYKETVYCKSGNIIHDENIYYIAGRYVNMDILKNYVTRRNAPDSIILESELKEYYLNGWKMIKKTSTGDFKLLQNRAVAIDPDEEYRLFHEGVLIEKTKEKNFLANNQVNRLNAMSNIIEKCKQLSSFTEFPILPTYKETQSFIAVTVPNYYYRGNIYRGSAIFRPDFCHRRYEFKVGDIASIKTIASNDTVLSSDAFPMKKEISTAETPTESTKKYERVITTLSDGSYLYREIGNSKEYESMLDRRENENVLDSVEIYTLEVCGMNMRGTYVGKDIIENVLTMIFNQYVLDNEGGSVIHVGSKEEKEELNETLVRELIKDCLGHTEGVVDFLVSKIGVDEFETYLDEYLEEEIVDMVEEEEEKENMKNEVIMG